MDNDPTVLKGDILGDIRDFENRESFFLLSPQMLMALDNGLNGGYKMPEQFIKPIYNSCMTFDPDLKSTDGYCSLLDIVKDGQIRPQGNVYVSKYFSPTDPKPEGVDSTFSGVLQIKTDEIGPSLYDWGLAPIFHYKSFEESARVSNYGITTVERYNTSTGRKEVVDFADLSESERKKYPSLPQSFDAGSKEDIATGRTLPNAVKKYAIDSVASFLGTMRNDITQSWVPQGTFKQVGYIKETVHQKASEADLTNKFLMKKVCNPVSCEYGTVITKFEDGDGEIVYFVENEGDVTEMMNVSSITKTIELQLEYTKEGVVEVNTVRYINEDPNTLGIIGTQYLSDYIDSYKAIIPASATNNMFACYSPEVFYVSKVID